MKKTKILIIRFSSIGDIIQALSSVEYLTRKFPQAEIHWVVRSDFSDLVKFNPLIHKVHSLDRKTGVKGLLELSKKLNAEGFTHVYDAHNNLRSHFICKFIWPKNLIRRSKKRIKRFLLFNMRINLYRKGITAHDTYIDPLAKWGIHKEPLNKSQLIIPNDVLERVRSQIPFKEYITLIPAAAWELKRWPLDYWKKLILSMPHKNFVILGGKNDSDLDELVLPEASSRILNLRGKLSLLESCAVISHGQMAVGCDTGLAHAADQLGAPIIFLLGPTAFGSPSRPTSYSMEVSLPCRPCTKDGRGQCHNTIYKQCLYDIHPHVVKSKIDHHV